MMLINRISVVDICVDVNITCILNLNALKLVDRDFLLQPHLFYIYIHLSPKDARALHCYLGPKSIDPNEKTLRKDFISEYLFCQLGNTNIVLSDITCCFISHYFWVIKEVHS